MVAWWMMIAIRLALAFSWLADSLCFVDELHGMVLFVMKGFFSECARKAVHEAMARGAIHGLEAATRSWVLH